MVKLPEAAMTNKLQSLPEGLRLKADKIIAKKFNVKEPAKKSNPFIDDAYAPFEQAMQMRQRKQAHLRDIRFRPEYRGTEVEFMCPVCGRRERLTFDDTELMRQHTYVVPCKSCPTDLDLDVKTIARHSEQMRWRYPW